MHDRLALSAPFSGRACGSVLAALAACAAFASPGAAQSRIKGANAAQVVVLGETPAARCYQEARRGAATRDAVEVCDAAFDGALTSRDAVATSVNRAIILQARGAYDAALADLAEARSRAPDFAPVHFNEGAIFIALERWSRTGRRSDARSRWRSKATSPAPTPAIRRRRSLRRSGRPRVSNSGASAWSVHPATPGRTPAPDAFAAIG